MSFLAQYPHLKTLQEIIPKKTKVYLVGGFLRDHYLNRSCLDFDFAVERNAISLAKRFADKIKGSFVMLDEEHACARVVKKEDGQELIFDFSDYRAKTFRQDLTLRDFTINTLAADLSDVDKILDVKNALKDIKAKKIRMASPKSFKDDPLRVLRAFSLAAILDFKIEPKTLAQIKKDKEKLAQVSAERIREELFKILASPRAAKTFKEMDKMGLLSKVIPQITIMYNCKQGGYHHLDVWPHSLEVVNQLEKLLEEYKDHSELSAYLAEEIGGGHSRAAVLKLAALLHDVGKPETRKEEKGRYTFHGHEHVSRAISRHVAKLLKFSTNERYALEDAVLHHMRPGYLSNFKQPSERSIFRFFRDAKSEAAAVALLAMADQRSTLGPMSTKAHHMHHQKICLDLLNRYFVKAKQDKETPPTRLITGHDLIKKLKLKPSPVFAKILREVEEKQALGKITTKAEALELAKKIGKV